jgi:hypothetical protein
VGVILTGPGATARWGQGDQGEGRPHRRAGPARGGVRRDAPERDRHRAGGPRAAAGPDPVRGTALRPHRAARAGWRTRRRSSASSGSCCRRCSPSSGRAPGATSATTSAPRSCAASSAACRCGRSRSCPAYLDLLREEPEEVRALADDLLITVTNFFRDREVFHALETEVIPRLFEGKGPEDTVRVWSVGCATGEEAYSLAILLLEEAARREVRPRLQVFASDLHERALERAREGFYPGDIEVDVTEERLRGSSTGGRRLPRAEGSAGADRLRAAQPARRSALLPAGPDRLPQHADLPAARRAEGRDGALPLRAAPDGFLVLGTSETLELGPVPGRAQGALHLPAAQRAGGRAPAARLPAGASPSGWGGSVPAERGGSCRTARCTSAWWSATRRPAFW